MLNGDPAAQLGALCAFLSSCTWAIGTVAYSRLSRAHTAFAVNLARSLTALPLFALTAFVFASPAGGLGDFRAAGAASLGWFLVSTFASYGLGDAVFLMSTQSLGVPGALAIASTYPMWTALVGWLAEGQRLAVGQILGLALTVAGVIGVILFSPRHQMSDRASRPMPAELAAGGGEGVGALAMAPRARQLVPGFPTRGVLLALAASLFWTLNGYSVFRGGQLLTMSVTNSIRMAMAIALSPLMGRILAPGKSMFLSVKTLRRSLWVFALEAFGGSAFFAYGMCHAPLAIGSTLSALAPVLSVPVAVALGQERFSKGRTAGVVTTAVGLKLLVG